MDEELRNSSGNRDHNNDAPFPPNQSSLDDSTNKHSNRSKFIGICIAIVSAIAVAVLCLVFVVFIPAQQQSAFESAQNAISQGDFDSAIEYLSKSGNSDEIQELYSQANEAKSKLETINNIFDSDDFSEDNINSANEAISYLNRYFPNYNGIKPYSTYIEAISDENNGNLYRAYLNYESIIDFKDASEKANSLNSRIEQLYQEGNQSFSQNDWKSAVANFEQIRGYDDSTDKLEKAKTEKDLDELANNVIGTRWANSCMISFSGYMNVFLEFTPSDNNIRTGTATIMQDTSTKQFVPGEDFNYSDSNANLQVGSYTYNVMSFDRIHLNGTSLDSTFDEDIRVTFSNTATVFYGDDKEYGRFMELSPEPFDATFGLSGWKSI